MALRMATTYALLLAALLQMSAGFREQPLPTKPVEVEMSDFGAGNPTVRVRLLMVRHGLSCANIISDYGSSVLQKLEHKNYPDPLLADCGAHQTTAASKIFEEEQLDFVGSSPMMRAIETAWLQFGQKTVNVVPHIGEQAHGAAKYAVMAGKKIGVFADVDNTPLPEEVQLDMLHQHYPDLDISFSYGNRTDADFSNWDKFEEFLAHRLLPDLRGKDEKKSYTLAFASHSNFLKDSVGRTPAKTWSGQQKFEPRRTICSEAMPKTKSGGASKPYNNQVLELFYEYDLVAGRLTLDLAAGCRSLNANSLLPVGVPGKPATLCEADFDRCMPGWRLRKPFMALQEDRQPSTSPAEIRSLLGTVQPVPKIPRTSEVTGQRVPAACETHHLCDIEGFPQVNSAEELWVEYWKWEEMMCKEHGNDPDDCSDLPEFPDVNSPLVCQCQLR